MMHTYLCPRMPKFISFRQGSSSVLFWSVISAAFIGPGTVTTCSKAGASFEMSLLWALLFSTLATILLQELAARVNMATGKNLGEIMSIKYQSKKASSRIPGFLFLAVSFGCAAYQAGNILGAVAGLRLLSPFPSFAYTLVIGILCFALLWKGTVGQVARFMGALVVIMGIIFLYIAIQVGPALGGLLKGSLLPTIPAGSGSLIIGLIGTTIVPYNLFLASGVQKKQSLSSMRLGIAIAVGIGGLISMAILISGTLLSGEYSYALLSGAIQEHTGKMGSVFFALGLFAAGFSSAITAPLAAAVCGQSFFRTASPESWSENGKYYKMTWIAVLLVGVLFGFMNVSPVPAILAAQGINGLLLPLVCIAIYLATRDQGMMPMEYRHRPWLDKVYLFIIWVTCFLGLYNIQKSTLNIFGIQGLTETKLILISASLGAAFVLLLNQDQERSRHQAGN